jgi:hypothetical protein
MLSRPPWPIGVPGNSKIEDPAAEVDLGEELLNDEDRAVSKPELL